MQHKRKNKGCLVIAIIIMVAIIIPFLYSCMTITEPSEKFDLPAVKEMMKEHWDVDIPKGGKLIYEVDDYFISDGSLYAVIQYKSNKEIREAYDWTNDTGEDAEVINDVIEELKVKEIARPNISDCKVYHMEDELDDLWLMFSEKAKILYIVESLI